MEYHRTEGNSKRIATVLSKEQFATYAKNASLCHMFVLPLGKPADAARQQGQASTSGQQQQQQPFMTMLVQQQLPFTLITAVEEYNV